MESLESENFELRRELDAKKLEISIITESKKHVLKLKEEEVRGLYKRLNEEQNESDNLREEIKVLREGLKKIDSLVDENEDLKKEVKTLKRVEEISNSKLRIESKKSIKYFGNIQDLKDSKLHLEEECNGLKQKLFNLTRELNIAKNKLKEEEERKLKQKPVREITTNNNQPKEDNFTERLGGNLEEREKSILADDVRLCGLRKDELVICIRRKSYKLFQKFLRENTLTLDDYIVINECLITRNFDYLYDIMNKYKLSLSELVEKYTLTEFAEHLEVFSIFNKGYLGLPNIRDWMTRVDVLADRNDTLGLLKLVNLGVLLSEKGNNLLKSHEFKCNDYLRAYVACKKNDILYLKGIVERGLTGDEKLALLANGVDYRNI